MLAFEMITPSTTYSGSPEASTDVAPRIWIWAPPPGAPLFSNMRAPATLPARLLSIERAGTRFNSGPATVATAVAATLRSVVVA